jgi:hypothetical protein
MKDHSTNETTTKNPSKPNTLDYRVSTRRPRLLYGARLAALLVAIGLIATAWRVTHEASFRKGTVATPPNSAATLPPGDVAEFYRSQIAPLLDAALQRNRRAADRAVASLHERFNAHRAGVKAFAENIAGWRTRFGVIQCFATDVWDKHVRGNTSANSVGAYIEEKFRTRVLSEPSLQADVEEVLKQYRQDLEASRNQLFAEIKLPLHGRNSPIVLDEKGLEKLCLDIDNRAKQLNAKTPRDSVVTGLAAVAGGWVGAETGEMVVGQILARVGTSVAVEAAEAATAAGGSALAGGTATGGGVGSLGGPAGTVVGIGVGVAIGSAIDWWMSDRLESHITDQCDEFLDTVEHKLVEGSEQSPGLRSSFEQAEKLADQRQRQAIIDALLEARK